jgi:guanyl-specific ribonuclease Sa
MAAKGREEEEREKRERDAVLAALATGFPELRASNDNVTAGGRASSDSRPSGGGNNPPPRGSGTGPSEPPRRVDRLPFKDADTTQRVQRALSDLDSGIKRYARDGIEFENRKNPLPVREKGYYKEYTVPPPAGVANRGVERLVVGKNGEVYYSPDHYENFVKIR